MAFEKIHDDNAIFDYIIGYKQRYDGLSPTYREIALHCGISSISTVKAILNRLEKGKRIEFIPGKAGGLMVVGGIWLFLPGGTDDR